MSTDSRHSINSFQPADSSRPKTNVITFQLLSAGLFGGFHRKVDSKLIGKENTSNNQEYQKKKFSSASVIIHQMDGNYPKPHRKSTAPSIISSSSAMQSALNSRENRSQKQFFSLCQCISVLFELNGIDGEHNKWLVSLQIKLESVW